ncbi:hypothetical protein YPPY102_4362, partial [Yersinia pestis PY-102]
MGGQVIEANRLAVITEA